MNFIPPKMNWNLPQNAYIIYERASEGFYVLPQGLIQIFEFFIPHGGSVEVKVTQTASYTQDLSIKAYFSQFPLSESINISNPSLSSFYFPRVQRNITLKDILFITPKDRRLFGFPAGKYYLNIQNMTNMINAYHLQFIERNYKETEEEEKRIINCPNPYPGPFTQLPFP